MSCGRCQDVPVRRVSWRPSYRLIPSRYPTVGLYDAIADPADLDVVFAIEALANPRIRDEIGELALVPKEERLTGPGATPVMAAFTHLNPEGSRFSDGTYGVYYAAHSLETAIAEVSHHRGVFLRRTAEPAIDVDMRLITANVEAELHDLLEADAAAGTSNRFAAVLDADDYGPSQGLGRRLRAARQLGHPLPERAPRRRRVRRHLPAACAAPRQGGGAPRAALGRRAHHALVREALAARRQRLSRAPGVGRALSADKRHSVASIRLTVSRHGRGNVPPATLMTYTLLVFAHLLAVSMALGAIVATDLRLLSKLAQDRTRIAPPNEFVTRIVMVALLVLYATGGALVWNGRARSP